MLAIWLLLACPREEGDTGSSSVAPSDTSPTHDTAPVDTAPPPADTGEVDDDGDGHPAASDCDDEDASIHPGASEQCDEVDEDCDGLVDEGATWPAYEDGDGDGYGSGKEVLVACSDEGWAAVDGDCDDEDAHTSPDQTEACDEHDHDCDGDPLNGDPCADEQVAGDLARPVVYAVDPEGDDFFALLGVTGDLDGSGADTVVGYCKGCRVGGDTRELFLYSGWGDARQYEHTDVATVVVSTQGLGPPSDTVIAGDLDGDGLDDLLGWEWEAFVAVAGPMATGSEPRVLFDHSGNLKYAKYEAALSPGDVDGDGHADVFAVLDYYDVGEVYLLQAEAPDFDYNVGHPSLRAESGSGLGLSLEHAGDVDGDGLPDFVVYDAGPVVVSGASLQPGGEAQVADVLVQSVPGWSRGLGLGDWDADGYDDWVVSCDDCTDSYDAEGVVVVLPGGAEPQVWSGEELQGWWGAEAEAGLGTQLTVADLDGDARKELVVTHGSSGSVVADVDEGLPTWTWEPDGTLRISGLTGRPHVADLDGDGDDDLVSRACSADGVDDVVERFCVIDGWDIPWSG